MREVQSVGCLGRKADRLECVLKKRKDHATLSLPVGFPPCSAKIPVCNSARQS